MGTKPLSILKKILGAGLGAFFFASNCAFAYSAETNFWIQRNKARHSVIPTKAGISTLRSPLETRGDDETVIYHIQDVHQNLEAQQDISKKILTLIKENKVDLIALEGAFDSINLETFRTFKDKSSIQVAADSLLKNHDISGPIHAALTNPDKNPPIIGVDHKEAYEANVNAYRVSAPKQKEARRKLSEAWVQLANEKKSNLNKSLYQFDRLVNRHARGEMKMGAYLPPLVKMAGASTESIASFLKALSLESTMNFSKVEREKKALLRTLVPKLKQREIEQLTQLSTAYSRQQLKAGAFFNALKAFCSMHQVSLKKYPSLKNYVHYVQLSDSIKSDTLFDDISRLEKKGYEALIRSNKERSLVEASKKLELEEKLVNFALTPKEWEDYKKYDVRRTTYEDFYLYAERRDTAIADNLLKAMKEHGAKRAVLVTGGFHSKGIQAAISDVSIVSLSPRISKVEEGTGYLSVFAQEKTPLDHMFQGQKLFLAKAPITPLAFIKGTLRVANNFLSKSANKLQVAALYVKTWLSQFSLGPSLTYDVNSDGVVSIKQKPRRRLALIIALPVLYAAGALIFQGLNQETLKQIGLVLGMSVFGAVVGDLGGVENPEPDETKREEDSSNGEPAEFSDDVSLQTVIFSPNSELPEFGKYEAKRKIGEGGMGKVYLAHDPSLDRDVAIKVWATDKVGTEGKNVFIREAKTLAKIEHPNVVSVYGLEGEAGDNPYMVMEYIKGQGLDNYIQEERDAEDIIKILKVIIDALNALQVVHDEGIVHRDIKPSNIMLTTENGLNEENPVAKLVDFGLAHTKAWTEGEPLAGIVGSPPYMSPEHINLNGNGNGGTTIDHRSDIFSMGSSLYELLTGFQPFVPDMSGVDKSDKAKYQTERYMRLFDLIAHKAPPNPRQYNDTIPVELANNIRKALEKKPEDRYQSARDFAEALEKVKNDIESSISGETMVFQPSETPLKEPTKKQNFFKWSIVVSIALIVAAIGYGVYNSVSRGPNTSGKTEVVEKTKKVGSSGKTSAWKKWPKFRDGVYAKLPDRPVTDFRHTQLLRHLEYGGYKFIAYTEISNKKLINKFLAQLQAYKYVEISFKTENGPEYSREYRVPKHMLFGFSILEKGKSIQRDRDYLWETMLTTPENIQQGDQVGYMQFLEERVDDGERIISLSKKTKPIKIPYGVHARGMNFTNRAHIESKYIPVEKLKEKVKAMPDDARLTMSLSIGGMEWGFNTRMDESIPPGQIPKKISYLYDRGLVELKDKVAMPRPGKFPGRKKTTSKNTNEKTSKMFLLPFLLVGFGFPFSIVGGRRLTTLVNRTLRSNEKGDQKSVEARLDKLISVLDLGLADFDARPSLWRALNQGAAHLSDTVYNLKHLEPVTTKLIQTERLVVVPNAELSAEGIIREVNEATALLKEKSPTGFAPAIKVVLVESHRDKVLELSAALKGNVQLVLETDLVGEEAARGLFLNERGRVVQTHLFVREGVQLPLSLMQALQRIRSNREESDLVQILMATLAFGSSQAVVKPLSHLLDMFSYRSLIKSQA